MDLKKTSTICTNLAVPGATTVWTLNFNMGYSKNFTCFAQCATATSPMIKVQLEVSFVTASNPNFVFTQNLSSPYYVVPDAYPDIFSNIVDTNFHAKGFQPPYAYIGRYKITGLTGNPSDATITIYNMFQEAGRTYGA